MNCDDYLAMLATLPVDELQHGRAREHSALCRDCDRVTRVVAEREYNMITAFDNLQSSVPVAQIATHALTTSRRQTFDRYFDWGIGVTIVAAVLIMLGLRMKPEPQSVSMVSETFRLQCLSPQQAAAIISPIIAPTGRQWSQLKSPVGLINVLASPEQMEKVRETLRIDDRPGQSYCAVEVTLPPARNTQVP